MTASRACLPGPLGRLGATFLLAVLLGLGVGAGLGYFVMFLHAPDATPTSAPPTSAPPTSAPPTSAPPTSAPPTSAPPTSAPPTSAPTATSTSAPQTTTPESVPSAGDAGCQRRDMGFSSFVCVCNATYCDRLPPVRAADRGTALVFTSSKEALRLDRQQLFFSYETNASSTQTLTVARTETFQSVYGFGGAFTDSAGITVLSLPPPTQDLLLRSYYSEDGLEYNIGRVPIGGTDFSTRPYSYADGPEKDLSGFQLQREDLQYKIPMIKRALAERPQGADPVLFFSSIWSPPAWMKTSDQFAGFGFLKEEYFQMYADYFVKFLEHYEAHNVTFFCLSTGNEPLNGVVPFKYFNSLGWEPGPMHRWIRDNLGPTIRQSKFKDIKIMAHDDQRILLPWLLDMVLADNATADYIDIIGYHWYLNFITPSSILDQVHRLYPDKPIVSSEACNGDKPWDFTRVQPGSWERGELYISDIVEVMNHWTTTWIDWNLALDRQGGPNWAENWVDAPIIVDAGRAEFYRSPTFYALAHLTKFVPRGARRVALASEGGPWLRGHVAHVAFLRPDGGLVVVLVNKHGSSRDVVIREQGRGQITVQMPPRSWVTTVYW